MLQRHYGGGFRIAVSFSVRCGLLLLDLCRCRIAFAGFDDYMGGLLVVSVFDEAVVGVRVDALIRSAELSCGEALCGLCRCPNPTGRY